MKQDRLKEFEGYGYTTIGEIDDETIVARRFDSGVVMIMAVHDKYVTQIRLTAEHMDKLFELKPKGAKATELPSGAVAESEVYGIDCKDDSCS